MRATPRSLRAKSAQRITSSAMCSDGAWLNGWSNAASTRKRSPNTPPVSGRSNVKRSGNAMNDATATTCAVSSRFACVSSSRRSAQTKSDRP